MSNAWLEDAYVVFKFVLHFQDRNTVIDRSRHFANRYCSVLHDCYRELKWISPPLSTKISRATDMIIVTFFVAHVQQCEQNIPKIDFRSVYNYLLVKWCTIYVINNWSFLFFRRSLTRHGADWYDSISGPIHSTADCWDIVEHRLSVGRRILSWAPNRNMFLTGPSGSTEWFISLTDFWQMNKS